MNNKLMQTAASQRFKLSRVTSVVLLCFATTSCDTMDVLSKKVPITNGRANTAKEVPTRILSAKEREAQTDAFVLKEKNAWEKADYDGLEALYQEWGTFDPSSLRADDGKRALALARNHLVLLDEARALIGKSDADNELAMQKLHLILLERPDHPDAKPLYDDLLKKKEVKQQEKLRKKLGYNKTVTLQFRDVSLKMIFEALSKTTNISFVLDKDVSSEQKATIYAQGMAFNDALDLLLQTNQLEKKVLSETSAIIYPNDVLHQREYKDLTIRTFNLEYADVKQVSTLLKSMLGIKQIEIDPRLSTLMIKDTPDVLQLAEKLIASQDLPDPEVMLEMEVLEVKRSFLQDLGVKVPTGLNVPVPTGGLLTIRDLDNVRPKDIVVNGVPGLQFSASTGDVNLLANPRIRVKNKDIAKIHIGEKVPLFTSNISSTGVSSQTIQYIDAGLKLELEPTISSSGDVNIKINLNVGSLGEQITSGSGTAFRVGTRFATTQLRLHDGETQVLAGLIDDQDRKNISKIPGIGDLPLLGKLFSKRNDDKSKTEIILSVTPRIIREQRQPTANQKEYWIGSEAQTGKRSPSPTFSGNGVPFFVPKPPPAPAAPKDDKPQSLNVPLPSGFSLGNGIGPKGAE